MHAWNFANNDVLILNLSTDDGLCGTSNGKAIKKLLSILESYCDVKCKDADTFKYLN